MKRSQVYAFGWNSFNQLEISDNRDGENIAIPTLVESRTQHQHSFATKVIAASWSSTIFQCHTEKVYQDLNEPILSPDEAEDEVAFVRFRGFPFSTSHDEVSQSRSSLNSQAECLVEDTKYFKFLGKDSLEGYVDSNGLIRAFSSSEESSTSRSDPVQTTEDSEAGIRQKIRWKDAVMDGQGRILALTRTEVEPELYLFSSMEVFKDQSQGSIEKSCKVQIDKVEVHSLKAGSSHFLIHTSPSNTNGNQLYSLGDSRYGQLGTSLPNASTSPMTAQAVSTFDLSEGFPSKIRKVETCGRHCIAMIEDGSAYVWGWNGDGQLGIETSSSDESSETTLKKKVGEPPSICYEPQLIILEDEDLDIVDVGCGNGHSVIVTDDGRVWVAGSNKHGQLGLESQSETKNSYPSFNPINVFGSDLRAQKVTCSNWATFVEVLRM